MAHSKKSSNFATCKRIRESGENPELSRSCKFHTTSATIGHWMDRHLGRCCTDWNKPENLSQAEQTPERARFTRTEENVNNYFKTNK